MPNDSTMMEIGWMNAAAPLNLAFAVSLMAVRLRRVGGSSPAAKERASSKHRKCKDDSDDPAARLQLTVRYPGMLFTDCFCSAGFTQLVM